MLYLELNGRQLLLPANTRATVEHVSPLFADGLEDSFSLPMELPAEGNEEALKHVHQLPLAERTTVFDHARIGHDGQPLFPGELHVLSTTEESVRATFLVEALVNKLRGLTLPDALQNERIDLLVEISEESTSFSIRPSYEDGGKCQFPMFLAPDLYGDDNPDWKTRGADFDNTQAYAVDDFILFTSYDKVQNTEVYQCIVAAAANEGPDTYPAKWNKAQYSVANAWDRASNQHHLNTLAGNFYTLVPWFYLKWVLKKALAVRGYRPVGEWMDDARTHELLLPNLSTIDAPVIPSTDSFFRVKQTDPVYYVPGTELRIPAQSETPLPEQDPDGLWDSTLFEWECPSAGTFVLKFRTTFDRFAPQDTANGWRPYTRAVLVDDLGASIQVQELAPVQFTDLTREATYTLVLTGGDVGRKFHAQFFQVQDRTTYSVGTPTFQNQRLWPTLPSDHFQNSSVRGWLNSVAPTVMVPDDNILVCRHMPDVEVTELLIAIADAYNLELVADEGSRTVTMNYRTSALARTQSNTEDASARRVGLTEIDHQRQVKGLSVAWDIDQSEENQVQLSVAPQYTSYTDLPYASSTGQLAVLKSTREVLKSIFRGGEYVWTRVGYHVPGKLGGVADGAKEITPDMKPLHMVRITKDDKEYMVPLMPGRGNSKWFHTSAELSTIYLCEFKKQTSSDGTVINVPGARSWGYGWDEEDLSATTLEWNRQDNFYQGMWQLHYREWAKMLVTAEPVTMDLLVDGPWMRGRAWQRQLHIHGQNYLAERIPVEYGGHNTPMVARGAYLYRLRSLPGVNGLPFETEPTFLCEGEGYASIVVTNETALFSLLTSTGYSTVRDAATGTLTTVADFDEHILPVGSYCLWASDDAGEPSGDVLELYELGAVATLSLGAAGLGAMTFLLVDSVVAGFTPPSPSALVQILMVNPANTMVGIDLSGQTAMETMNLAWTDSAMDLSGSPGILTITVDNPNLAVVTPPPGSTLRNITIGEGMLDEASVDALINACDATFAGGNCQIDGGTNSPRGTASDTNYGDCVANGWTFTLN